MFNQTQAEEKPILETSWKARKGQILYNNLASYLPDWCYFLTKAPSDVCIFIRNPWKPESKTEQNIQGHP